ncbi:hypothetical protein BGW37DRAFT_480972 [Umbelopsis sp. PMI_123]|nr:hypothetical protein BGW37DRAFT_480972 [Umbelopsis sp. PMI_123]
MHKWTPKDDYESYQGHADMIRPPNTPLPTAMNSYSSAQSDAPVWPEYIGHGTTKDLPPSPIEEKERFFSPKTHQYHSLYNLQRTTGYDLQIHAKIDKGFFITNGDWTCYRRNYFQVSATLSLQPTKQGDLYEPELPILLGIDGQTYTVDEFLFGVSAEAASSGKYIDLVQHTAKRDKGPQVTPPLKPVRTEGPQHGLAMFERLQFKTATANNGKRRATQQYFHLNVEVFARCSDSSIHRVAVCKSLPVVVRGRSPGHYTDKGQRRVKSLPSSPSDDRSFSKSPPNLPDYGYPYSPYTTFPPPYGSTPITEMPPPSGPHSMMMMHPPPPRQQQHDGDSGYNPALSPAMAQYPPSGRYMPHDGNASSPELSSPDMHLSRNAAQAEMDKAPTGNPYPGQRPPLGLNIQISNDGWDRHRTNSTNSLSSSYVSSISSPPPSDDRMYQYGMVPTMNPPYPKPNAIPYPPVEEDIPSMNRWQYRPDQSWTEPHPSEHRDGLVHPLQ